METLFALLLLCTANSTQGVSNAELWCRSCIGRDMLLNKQSSDRWFEARWSSQCLGPRWTLLGCINCFGWTSLAISPQNQCFGTWSSPKTLFAAIFHTDIAKAISNDNTSNGCIIRSKWQQNIRGAFVTTVHLQIIAPHQGAQPIIVSIVLVTNFIACYFDWVLRSYHLTNLTTYV